MDSNKWNFVSYVARGNIFRYVHWRLGISLYKFTLYDKNPEDWEKAFTLYDEKFTSAALVLLYCNKKALLLAHTVRTVTSLPFPTVRYRFERRYLRCIRVQLQLLQQYAEALHSPTHGAGHGPKYPLSRTKLGTVAHALLRHRYSRYIEISCPSMYRDQLWLKNLCRTGKKTPFQGDKENIFSKNKTYFVGKMLRGKHKTSIKR